jgi:hypothetical protein
MKIYIIDRRANEVSITDRKQKYRWFNEICKWLAVENINIIRSLQVL